MRNINIPNIVKFEGLISFAESRIHYKTCVIKLNGKQIMITKKMALDCIHESNIQYDINDKNFTFSNRNRATGNWWCDPSYKRFKFDHFIGLYDDTREILHVFYIPANKYPEPQRVFFDRKDRGRIKITINPNSNNFVDDFSKIAFGDFPKEEIPCPCSNHM